MRATVSITYGFPLARRVPGILAAVLGVTFFGASIRCQSDAGSTTKPASSKTTQSKSTQAKSTKKPAPHSTAQHSTAKRKGGKRVGTRASRVARTARIRQAFVASTELRPMAQQLA